MENNKKNIVEVTPEEIPANPPEKKAEKTPQKPKKQGKIKTFLKSRKAKHGSIAILLTVIFLVIVIALNIVTNLLVTRFPALSFDFTSSSVYELQSTSIEYVESLTKDVTIYVLQNEKDFEAADEYYVQANKLLKKFEQYSDKITLKYIDLSKNPTFTSKYPSVDWSDGSSLILVESGEDYRVVTTEDMFEYNQEYLYTYGSYVIESQHVEQAVVTAILNVTTEEKVKVTILSGQGELDSSYLSKVLANNAYETEEVSLLSGKISDDSQFVIMYAPTQDIDANVFETLTNWLYNDGKYGHTLLYVPNDHATDELPNIEALLDEWGMSIQKGYVFETDTSHMTNTQQPYLITIFDYADETYTKALKEKNIPVVMLYTMPISIKDEDKAKAVLTTSDSAVLMPLNADENWDYNDEKPQTLNGAVVSTQGTEDKKSNVIVIGSYDALSEGALSTTSFNNSAYFINMFNTVSQRDDIGITIEGKNLDAQQLGIASSATATIISAFVRFIIPIAVIFIGLIIWLRRRNK